MSLKVVLFYNQYQRGFTETWYMAGSSPPSQLPPNFDALLKAAVKFRASGTVLTGARFSVVGSILSNTFRFLNKYTADNQNYNAAADPDDVVSTTSLWQLRDTGFHKKLMFLRGLADVDVVRDIDGSDKPTAGLLAAMNTYLQAAQFANLQLRFQNTPSNTPGFAQYQISSVDKTGGGNTSLSTMTLTSDPSADIQNDTIFVIKGVRKNDCPGIPKIAKAISVVAGPPASITFTYRFRNQAIVNPSNAFVMKQQFTYASLAYGEFIEFSEHKTGRPFFQPRGRSSVALRRL